MWKAPSPKRDAGSSIRSDAHYTLSRRRERQSPKVLMSDFTGFLMSTPTEQRSSRGPLSPHQEIPPARCRNCAQSSPGSRKLFPRIVWFLTHWSIVHLAFSVLSFFRGDWETQIWRCVQSWEMDEEREKGKGRERPSAGWYSMMTKYVPAVVIR